MMGQLIVWVVVRRKIKMMSENKVGGNLRRNILDSFLQCNQLCICGSFVLPNLRLQGNKHD